MYHSYNEGTNEMQAPARMEGCGHKKEMYEFCYKHIHHYIMIETTDGNVYEGIIIHVDEEHVQLLMPEKHHHREQIDNENRFGFGPGFGGPGGYGGFGGYGGPGGYGGYGGFPRRFRRGVFPFGGISRFFFPFFW